MKKAQLFVLLILLSALTAVSCSKSGNTGADEPSLGKVYVLNQGGFGRGEASITIFDPETRSITQNAFLARNGRPLGDVLQSATIVGEDLYLVVNNSKKIEVVDLNTLASKKTINMPSSSSPRYMAAVSNDVAFVTNLFNDHVYELNLSTGTVVDSINVGGWTEDIAYVNGRLFVTKNPFAGTDFESEVIVINAQSKEIEANISTLPGPQRIVVVGQSIWVNCGGEWAANNGGLVEINTTNLSVSQTVDFGGSTSNLSFSEADNSLFVLANGIVRVPLNDVNNRTTISDKSYYGLKIYKKDNVIIYAADARNFTQNGMVYMYNNDGNTADSISTGIVPYDFIFVD